MTSHEVEAAVPEKIRRMVAAFRAVTELRVDYEELPIGHSARAEAFFDCATQACMVRLRNDWKPIDVAHELMHFEMDIVGRYPLPVFSPGLAPSEEMKRVCVTMRGYVEDELVHAKLRSLGFAFVGEVIDQSVFDRYRRWTSEINRTGHYDGDGADLLDSVNRGILRRAAVYVQARLLHECHGAHLARPLRRAARCFTAAVRERQCEVAAYGDAVVDLFHGHDVSTPEGHGRIKLGWIQLERADRWLTLGRYERDAEGRVVLRVMNVKQDAAHTVNE